MNYSELVLKFQKELPGEKAHLEFMPNREKTSLQIQSGVEYRDAAVAIVLFHDTDSNLKTIVIKRQTYDGSHSGQISFPGGKKDLHDSSLIETACRECMEEIGIDPSTFEFLGQLTPLYVHVSGFLISPFVFFSESNAFEYKKSEREASEVYEINLPQLFLPESKVEIDIKLNQGLMIRKVPHFEQGSVSIWGATALILNELKALIED